MNQILVTKKLYITPELKRKKKIYKFDFFISIFLVCILISLCIYAEYDRNKSEEVSQDILANMTIANEDETVSKDKLLIVVLDEQENNATEVEQIDNSSSSGGNTQVESNQKNVKSTANGYNYTTVASISIPKINVNYPILDGETDTTEETEALLKISPCRFWGPEPNEIGNFCIVGHNYRNSKFFSKVPTLENNDIIEITDLSNRTISYKVYDKSIVDPTDVSCTSQLTNGKKEITLITCTDDSQQRYIIKAREIK